MKLYQVKFRTEVEIFNEETDEPQNVEIIMDFHLGAMDMGSALEEGIIYLESLVAEDKLVGYEITEIVDTNFWIVNWEKHEENDFEVTSETPPEDVMKFQCKCGHEIVVKEGWNRLLCSECGGSIERNRVVGSKGKFIFIDI